MAGAMRKVGEYLGLVEQADYDDEFDDFEPVAPARPHTPAVSHKVANLDEHRRTSPRPVAAPSQGAMTRIETVTPRTYNDARTIGEHYREGVPVIMNLSEIDNSDAKRLVDFAAGLVFSVHGSLNRVTEKVFLLSPESILVTDEDKQRIAAGGFYSQR